MMAGLKGHDWLSSAAAPQKLGFSRSKRSAGRKEKLFRKAGAPNLAASGMQAFRRDQSLPGSSSYGAGKHPLPWSGNSFAAGGILPTLGCFCLPVAWKRGRGSRSPGGGAVLSLPFPGSSEFDRSAGAEQPDWTRNRASPDRGFSRVFVFPNRLVKLNAAPEMAENPAAGPLDSKTGQNRPPLSAPSTSRRVKTPS